MIEGFIYLGCILFILGIIYIWNSRKERKRKWKIRKGDNYSRIYWELDDVGQWRQIVFDCKYYAKDAPRHVVYISQNWEDYPDWAHNRKDEILTRIKSELREPEYTIVEKV